MTFVKANSFETYPKWDYTVTPTIEGTLVEKRMDITPKHYNFYIIETAGKKGERFSVLGTKILDDTIGKYNIGTIVKITYKGEGKTSSGQGFHNFEVEYDDATLTATPDMAENIMGS